MDYRSVKQLSCKEYRTLQLGSLCHVKSMTILRPFWLPVRYSINFNFFFLTFKALYGMAPNYIIDLIDTKTNTRYLLRSNEGVLVKHPSGRMKKSFGDISFSVAASTLWNTLPVSLRSIKCISTFKSNLKTYLFKLAFNISQILNICINSFQVIYCCNALLITQHVKKRTINE